MHTQCKTSGLIESNKRPMGLVNWLVVLNHLPYGIQLSFMPNGHAADVKYLVVVFLRCEFIYIRQSVSLHDQPFSIYLRCQLLHLLPC